MTHEQRLKIYHQRSAHHPMQWRKTFRYEIAEPVHPVLAEFRRSHRRRKVRNVFGLSEVNEIEKLSTMLLDTTTTANDATKKT